MRISTLRPFKNVNFCSSSRKTKNLTAGIYGIFRGLKFEPDTEIGQKGTFFKGFYERLSPASYSSSASSPVCRLFPKASVAPKLPAEAAEHVEQPAYIQFLLLSLYSPSPLILQRLFSCCFPYDLHKAAIKPSASLGERYALGLKSSADAPQVPKGRSSEPERLLIKVFGRSAKLLHRYIPMFFGRPDFTFAAHDFKSLNQTRPCFTRNNDCIHKAPVCCTVRI